MELTIDIEFYRKIKLITFFYCRAKKICEMETIWEKLGSSWGGADFHFIAVPVVEKKDNESGEIIKAIIEKKFKAQSIIFLVMLTWFFFAGVYCDC